MDTYKWRATGPIGNPYILWRSVSIDGEGKNAIAVVSNGRLYVTTDGGRYWTEKQPAGNFDKNWLTAKVSKNGLVMIACVAGGRVYLSTDSGANWAETQPAGNNNMGWRSVTADYDGSNLLAVVFDGRAYISTDSGVSWAETQPAGNNNKRWFTCASNTDGSILICVEKDGRVYLSKDGGTNWAETQPAGNYDKAWRVVDMDNSGNNIILVAFYSRVYLTKNSGDNWAETQPEGNINNAWITVAIDGNGINMIAGVQDGKLFISNNSGGVWHQRHPIGSVDAGWYSVSSDDDGNTILVANQARRLYIGEKYKLPEKKTWNDIYPMMGLQAHGAFNKWWIHKTYPLYTKRFGIYQNKGHIICKYTYPPNPRTALQQNQRNWMAYAVSYWQGFDNNTKNYYNEWAFDKNLYGYHRYISLYLNANKNMIIYWNTLEKDAADTSTIPQYMNSGYLPSVHFARNIYWESQKQASGNNTTIPQYMYNPSSPSVEFARNIYWESQIKESGKPFKIPDYISLQIPYWAAPTFNNNSGLINRTSGSNFFAATTFANLDTTYLKADLPSAGTFLVYVNLRISIVGNAFVYGVVQLYNNTDSAAVANSTRVVIESNPNTQGRISLTMGFLWIITVDAAKTLYLQGFANIANDVSVDADVNGYNQMGWIKLVN